MKKYFAHCDFKLDGSPLCMAILDMLSVSSKSASKCSTRDWPMPLILETGEDGILQRVTLGNHENASTVTAADLEARTEPFSGMDRHCTIAVTYYDMGIGRLKLPALPEREPKGFFASSNGRHQLGGALPQGFKPAKTSFTNDTQFIGTLRGNDPAMPNLTNDIHICAPIFDEFNHIILDYSDPLSPKVSNHSELPDLFIQSAYGKVEDATSATWQTVKLDIRPISTNSLEEDNEENGATRIGLTGVPRFEQSPTIPISPKTGKPIPFLCQFTSYASPKLRPDSLKRIDTSKQFHPPIHLTFWNDGQIFLYWEAETNLLGITFQNT